MPDAPQIGGRGGTSGNEPMLSCKELMVEQLIRAMTPTAQCQLTRECAQRALAVFERWHPHDDRPRHALTLLLAPERGSLYDAWNALWNAADSVNGGASSGARAIYWSRPVLDDAICVSRQERTELTIIVAWKTAEAATAGIGWEKERQWQRQRALAMLMGGTR